MASEEHVWNLFDTYVVQYTVKTGTSSYTWHFVVRSVKGGKKQSRWDCELKCLAMCQERKLQFNMNSMQTEAHRCSAIVRRLFVLEADDG